ncbi:MAG TPA: asparagine synthase-related protein [Candidatus Binatia bacterium]|nr:asparagine synthase-related protein [Candidatus Binatia bacterium]
MIAAVVGRLDADAVLARLRAALATGAGPGRPATGVLGSGGVAGAESGATARERDVLIAGDLDLLGAEGADAAALLRLYRLEGRDFVSRLEGAFALLLWDAQRRTLLAASDPFGVKRLYYTEGPTVAVASSPRAALAAAGRPAEVDPAAVFLYLNFGFVPTPYTVFRRLRRLPPGHVLMAGDGWLRVLPYWDIVYAERPASVGAAAARVDRLAEQAVRRALAGLEVKTAGAFLSGGTDSSTVVGLMARTTGERPNAFSIGFDVARYDELHYATLAARHFDAAHYTHVVSPEEAFAALPRLVAGFPEPFANNSAIGTLACAELARQCGVRSLLAGDGGDEIFGGNERYRTDRVFARYHRLPGPLRRLVIEPVLARVPADAPGLLGRAHRYVRRANLPNPQRFYSYEFFVAQEAAWLLAPDFLAAVDPAAPVALLQEHWRRARAGEELNRLLYLDLKLTIADSDLPKVTRTAALAGVGVRFPFLDRALVEETASWPAWFKVRGLEKRYLFKRAFRSLLPAEVLAKSKHGFGVPTSHWLRSHPRFRALARDTLLAGPALARGYFRREGLERLFALHDADPTPYYGDILWTLLMLELWHREHEGRRA